MSLVEVVRRRGAALELGTLVAWQTAAESPNRVRSVSALSTPHGDAFFEAIERDADQKTRSQYIELFRMSVALRRRTSKQKIGSFFGGCTKAKCPTRWRSGASRDSSSPVH
ncbi:MAG: hypothetical protein GEU99_06480 [Luteitalea sp.]|nr:hypothetical protein [Luteitalea sp.]